MVVERESHTTTSKEDELRLQTPRTAEVEGKHDHQQLKEMKKVVVNNIVHQLARNEGL